MRVLLLLLLFIVSTSARAQQKEGGPGNAERQAKTDQRGTARAPLVVNVVRPDSSDAQKEQAAQEKAEHIKDERWLMRATVLLAVCTILLAGGTVFLAVFTYNLWSDTKASADATLIHLESTSQRQLRAYVHMENESTVTPSPNLTESPHIRLIFKNSGATPAYDVRISGQTAWVPERMNSPFPIISEEGGMSRAPISPGGHVNQDFDPQMIPANVREAMAQHQTISLYVFGDVKYHDAFGKKRTTNFRFRVVGGFGLEACNEGNDAD